MLSFCSSSSKSNHQVLPWVAREFSTAKFTYANKSNNISSNKGQRSSKDNYIMGVQKLIQYYSTTLTFSRQLEYRQHLLFLPSLEVFPLFFSFQKQKCLATKVRPKNSCTSPFMSLDISGYPIIICKLSSPKSLSSIKWGYR